MPEYIVICVEYDHRENIIQATFANSFDEAEKIANNYMCESVYVHIIPCDYSMQD